MDLTWELLAIQNHWWKGANLKFDPVLRQYEKNKLKARPEILSQVDLKRDGVHFLTGSRGTGKTTALKLMIKKLIEEDGIKPRQIFYYSCHNLDSAEQLNEMIKLFLNQANRRQRAYIFIDEITMIKDWQSGLNHLKKAGKFKKATAIFSGSFLEKEIDGGINILNIASLAFAEFVGLINPVFHQKIKRGNYPAWADKIEYYLDIYLLTGGQIGAINDYYFNGAVSQNVYSNTLYWLLANVARLGRDPALVRQIMEKIILNLGQSVGYKTLAAKTRARTHLTAAEYLDLLEKMFVIKTIYQSDGGQPTSRKAKKVYFQDPFFFWLFYAYTHGSLNYWQLARERLFDRAVFSHLLENVIFSRLLKDGKNNLTYWRDNVKKQEIHFLARRGKKLMPILIRYDKEIKDGDFKIFKQAGLKRGIIISKDKLENKGDFKIMPLSYFLMFY